MEQHKSLGIYISGHEATVALVSKGGEGFDIQNAFTVGVEIDDEGTDSDFSYSKLATAIAAQCKERQLVFSETSIALDCTMYRQQMLHSEFTDVRQISQTISFDAEEALAVDAAETAVTFELFGRAALGGSDISVFAAEAAMLSEVIIAMQNSALDPVTVEADSVCLRRFIRDTFATKDERPMWCALSGSNCYLVTPAGENQKEFVRTFVTGARRNKEVMLAREVMMTKASMPAAAQADGFKVLDGTGEINFSRLSEELGFGAVKAELAGIAEDTADSVDMVDVAIAAGAAIGQLVRSEKIDFRAGFMPYQGKKEMLEKSLRLLSIAVVVLLVAVGVYFHMQYFKVSGYIGKLNEKFSAEYKIAVPGTKLGTSPVRKLKSQINRIKDVKSGQLSAAGDDSIEAKLTFLFEAFNDVPKNVDLDIAKVSVTTKTMNITGNTSSRGYLALFGAIDKHAKLARGKSTYESKDNRDYFNLTVEMK